MKTNWLLQFCFRSKIWKLGGFVACKWWKQVALCVYQWVIKVFTQKKYQDHIPCSFCLQACLCWW